MSSNCLQSEDSLNRIYKSMVGYIDENIACQGASEAIRRRATLDTADSSQNRMEKEGMKRRTIFHSLLIILLCRLVVINNHNFTDNFFCLFA